MNIYLLGPTLQLQKLQRVVLIPAPLTSILTSMPLSITALNPQRPFSVSTGDYQFSNPSGTQSAPQIDLYLAARAKFPGVFFPAMGNHECTGATASNCGSGNTDRLTLNYNNFLSMLLAPIKQTSSGFSPSVPTARSPGRTATWTRGTTWSARWR